MNQSKKVTFALGVGCGVIVILCIGMCAGGMVTTGFFVKMALQHPENVTMHIDAPIQVTKGEELVIHIEVENVAPESQLLHSIDISSDYLAGIVIRSADPPFVDSFDVSAGDMTSYTFQHKIPPGTAVDVQLSAVAIESGDFAGLIQVCIKNGYICESLATRTVVEE